MPDLFLSRAIHDPAVAAQVLQALDKWAAVIPFSPIRSFSEKKKLTNVNEHACYTVRVISQIEKRWFAAHQIPYRGQDLPHRALGEDDFSLWSLRFEVAADFEAHQRSIELIETRRRVECRECGARGEITCPECSGRGKQDCSCCCGRGRIQKTRSVPYVAACTETHSPGARCYTCNDKNLVNKERYETYEETCDRCAGRGEVDCDSCQGRGVITCPQCEGCRYMLGWLSAEQSEAPKKTEDTFIPDSLPKFKKSKAPTSMLQGPFVHEQDERGALAHISLPDAPASPHLVAKFDSCRAGHEGHVNRQRVTVEQCSVYTCSYEHGGDQYDIYVNARHGLVEDLDGPIQATIDQFDEEAQRLFGLGKLAEAYRMNMRALCMDEASPSEKSLRSTLLRQLAWRHVLQGGVTCLLTSLALLATGIHPNLDGTVVVSAFMSLMLTVGALFWFARERAVTMGAGTATATACLTGGLAALGFAQPRFDEVGPMAVLNWGSLCTVGLLAWLLPVYRDGFRRNLHCIEDSQWSQDGMPKQLEEFVDGLDPRHSADVRLVAALGVAVVLALAFQLQVKAHVETERAMRTSAHIRTGALGMMRAGDYDGAGHSLRRLLADADAPTVTGA